MMDKEYYKNINHLNKVGNIVYFYSAIAILLLLTSLALCFVGLKTDQPVMIHISVFSFIMGLLVGIIGIIRLEKIKND